MEAEAEAKSKKKTQINERIVEELSIVTVMLDKKREELSAYEKKIKLYEESLKSREESMRDSIQKE